MSAPVAYSDERSGLLNGPYAPTWAEDLDASYEHGTWVSGPALWAFVIAAGCCAPVAAIVLWWLA